MSAPPTKKSKRKEANPLPWVILVIAVICGAIWSVSRGSDKTHKVAVEKETTVLILPPPPPPPPPKLEPPPPKEETKPEEEMMVQEPVPEDEPPPDNSPETPPGPDLGPGSANGNGPAIGGGGGGNGKVGSRRVSSSKFGWYAAKVQSSIREALAGNTATRSAVFSDLTVKVWADSNGRITRAVLVGSSGNTVVDQAIKNRILTGLQLPQAPPSDMPMPITLRISARKPSL